MTEEIRKILLEAADVKYRDFNQSLVPGNGAPIIGVRMPQLRKIAKKTAKEAGRKYIEEISSRESAEQVCHEELLLHGMVIGYLKCDMDERKELLDEFIPRIDNWAVCDSCCTTYKFMKEDREEWFAYLLKYIDSGEEYEIRFAVVCFLNYFLDEEFIDRVMEILGELRHDGYYVKMAVAWALSYCYIKFPEKTWELLAGGRLDNFTHQKSIRKIKESYQVSKEEKERLNALWRPGKDIKEEK